MPTRDATPPRMSLRGIMSTNVQSVADDTPLLQVVERLRQSAISALLVTRRGEPVGILTEYDLARALGEGRSVEETAGSLMTQGVISLPIDTEVHAAYHTMLVRGIRHLLVTEDGVLTGMVSESDFRRRGGIDLLVDPVSVTRVMNRHPPQTSRLTPLRAAARMMQAERQHYLLVMDERRAVGVLTERDMMRLFAAAQGDPPVGEVMSAPPITIAPEASLIDAAARMRESEIRLLLVTDGDDVLLGALHEHDLLRRLEDGYVHILQHLLEEQFQALEQNRFFSVVNELPQRLIVKDTRSVYLACNRSFADDVGLPIADVIGKTDADFFPPDLAARYRADDQRVMREKQTLTLEEPYQHDGRPAWLRTTKKPLLGEDGTVVGLVVIFDDVTEERRATEEVRRRGWTLEALNRANRAVIHADGEADLLQAVCEAVILDDEYPLCWIGWCRDDPQRTVSVAAAAGAALAYTRGLEVSWGEGPLGQGPVGRCVRSGTSVINNDIMAVFYHPWQTRAASFGLRAGLSIPLRSGGAVVGAMMIYSRAIGGFGPEEVTLFEAFADSLMYGIDTRRTRQAYEASVRAQAADERELRKALEDALMAMAGVLEQRDPYTAGHQKHVAELAVAIGREMGLDQESLHALHLAAIVHDLGKIEVPVEILTKPARLNPQEFALVKRHPEVGYNLLRMINFPWPIADIIRQHHEYLDGSGYPHGLHGDQILPQARVLTVADIVESISSDRPYRPAQGVAVAMAEISRLRGTKLDPAVVDAAIAVIGRGEFTPHVL